MGIGDGAEESGCSRSQHNSSPNPTLVLNRGEPPAAHHLADSEWVITIMEKVGRAREEESARPWAKQCIYRVPRYLRETDERAYVPRLVSIGPYHRGRHPEMEPHKWRAVHSLLRGTGDGIELYLESIKSVEDEARACYEGEVRMGSEEFVEMMVVDGTFVLELFLWAAGKDFGNYSDDDPVFAMRGTLHCIRRDMIMLENQIPFFVLDRLLALQMRQRPWPVSLAALALHFFHALAPTDEPLGDSDSSEVVGLHCLDVFRKSLLQSCGLILCCADRPERPLEYRELSRVSWDTLRRRRGSSSGRRQQMIRCVSELREAGIKFRSRRTGRFWDIQFKHGVLYIPRLLIDDGTKSLLLNLIAFEQCRLDRGNNVTSYVIFMDNLINSDRDVGYLHYHGIIEHWLGSDAEVADLFNRLCREVVFDIGRSHLSAVSRGVNRYCDHRWNAWRAGLIHTYFGSPWAIISLVAAVVLLLLTFAQTFYAVYSYHRPSS